jgi:cell wall-associated NlpC family hydrolase
MVDSEHGRRQRRRRSPVISPVLRPALWSALLGAVAAAALATPAWAEPPLPNTVPDTGQRPAVTGSLRLPGSVPGAVPGSPGALPGLPGAVPGRPGTLPGRPGAVPGATAVPVDPAAGPLIAQINTADALVGQLGDDLVRIKGERDEAQAQLALADTELKRAQETLARAQEEAKAAAADAVKAAAALPPGEFGADLHDLSTLQRISRGDRAEGATTGVSGEVARATAAEKIAREAYASAQQRVTDRSQAFTRAETTLHQQEATLLKLRKDNAALLLEVEKREDAAEQQIGSSYVSSQSVSGLVADPRALAAVRYALAQLGDPYLWAAEGPNRFDCSGLMLAAYTSAGYHDLPRVSRDQYFATRGRTVSPTALLPGDLLFFASGNSWTSIHHVAMYIGGGRMVEAPRTGDVVKISVVRWTRLYAATRVVGGVPAPATPAPVPPPTTTKPNPKPKPTPSGSAKPTPKPTRTATPKPTGGTPTPTKSPSGSPSPSTSPSPSPSPTPTESTAPSSPASEPTTEPTTAASSIAPTTSSSEATSSSPSAAG